MSFHKAIEPRLTLDSGEPDRAADFPPRTMPANIAHKTNALGWLAVRGSATGISIRLRWRRLRWSLRFWYGLLSGRGEELVIGGKIVLSRFDERHRASIGNQVKGLLQLSQGQSLDC